MNEQPENNVTQAMNQVLNDYVTENANLRIIIKQLEIELNELRKDKEGDD
jgi:hypothetical protein